MLYMLPQGTHADRLSECLQGAISRLALLISPSPPPTPKNRISNLSRTGQLVRSAARTSVKQCCVMPRINFCHWPYGLRSIGGLHYYRIDIVRSGGGRERLRRFGSVEGGRWGGGGRGSIRGSLSFVLSIGVGSVLLIVNSAKLLTENNPLLLFGQPRNFTFAIARSLQQRICSVSFVRTVKWIKKFKHLN